MEKSKEDLIDIINTSSTRGLPMKIKSNKKIYNFLINNSQFLQKDAKILERLYVFINDIKTIPLCKTCNIEKVKFINFKNGYRNYCSIKCSSNNNNTKKLREKTNVDRYGFPHTFQDEKMKEKRKIKNNKKYGTDYTWQSEEVKNTIKKTNKERYGFEYPTQNNIVKDNTKETNKKRYGVEYPTQNKSIKSQLIKTNNKKYGGNSPMSNLKIKEISLQTFYKNRELKQNKELISILNKYNIDLKNYNCILDYNNKNYKLTCNKCNTITNIDIKSIYNRVHKCKITPCINCMPYYSSGIEKKFVDFLKEIYNGEIIQSDRKILNGKEVDILLPELNIGIEINGLYWHSDAQKNDKNYHYNKTQLAKEKGYQLFHFFEDEIIKGMELIYSILISKKGINAKNNINEINYKYGLNIHKFKKYYARKLILKSHNKGKTGEKTKYKQFLKEYHIQNDDNAKYYYSLEDQEGNILSIMTFKTMSVDKNQQKNNNKDDDMKIFELSRYVILPGIQIIGGFSRLLKSFKKEMDRIYINEKNKPKIKILTYSNLRYSNEDDNVYLRNGFEKINFTGVNYYYFFEGKKMHRFNFRKDNLYNKYLPERGIEVDIDYKKESEKGMVQKLIDNGYSVNKIFDAGHIKWMKQL